MATVLESFVENSYRTAAPVLSFDEARGLALEFGTPLLAVSQSAVLRNFEGLRAGLPGVELFYAAKSNPDHHILTTLQEAGCSVDVCSVGEMKAALAAGFTPERMLHTHPCKTVENLETCYRTGLRWFVYDNENELPKISRYAPEANLLLRVAVASTSSVINLSAKFGAAPPDAVALMCSARDAGLSVRGIAFHVGSQCLSPDDYRTALMRVRQVWDEAAAAGIELDVLDIGGGMPAPYRTSVLSLESYCQSVMQAIESIFGDLLPGIRVIAEPGRVMSADTVTLVTSVIGKSPRNGQTQYIIDDGLYGSFSGKVYDHTDFRLMAEGQDERACYPCVVAGPTCDSTDIVARDQDMPDLEIGEILLVPTMGSYTAASASTFNGLDLARSVAVR